MQYQPRYMVCITAVHYQQALVLAGELGMRLLQAHGHHGLGRLYRQTGRAAPARTALAAVSDPDMTLT